MQEGRTVSFLKYDDDHQSETKTLLSVDNILLQNGTQQAAVRMLVRTWNDEEIYENFITRCDGSRFYIDMSFYLNEFYLAKNDGMDVSISGDFLEFPANMKSGDRLKDGAVLVEMSMEGIPAMSLNYKISNRKVIAQERVETNAGTFDCFKITYHFESDMGLMNVHGTAIEWWSEDMIAVKREEYDAKGNLVSTSTVESVR